MDAPPQGLVESLLHVQMVCKTLQRKSAIPKLSEAAGQRTGAANCPTSAAGEQNDCRVWKYDPFLGCAKAPFSPAASTSSVSPRSSPLFSVMRVSATSRGRPEAALGRVQASEGNGLGQTHSTSPGEASLNPSPSAASHPQSSHVWGIDGEKADLSFRISCPAFTRMLGLRISKRNRPLSGWRVARREHT